MPHATYFGLDWPFTPKRREKKLTASSRQRSHPDAVDVTEQFVFSAIWVRRACLTVDPFTGRSMSSTGSSCNDQCSKRHDIP